MSSLHSESILLSGNRLKAVREWRNVSQAKLADVLECSTNELQQAEDGVSNLSCKQLRVLREFLVVEGMPFTKDDVEVFRGRLLYWRDLIRNRKISEAMKIQKTIEGIASYPFEPDLTTMYNMFEIMGLLVEGELEIAERELEGHAKHLAEMSNENLYYYYRNAGTHRSLIGQSKDALTHYLKALAVGEKDDAILKQDGAIYYNIAACYFDLHLPYQTISFIQRTCETLDDDRTKMYRLHLDILLAVSYTRISKIDDARYLLDKCLICVKGIGDKMLIGNVLYNFGLLEKTAMLWEQAIGYFDKALAYYQDGSELYFDSLYHKARCFIEIGEYEKVSTLLTLAGNMQFDKHRRILLVKSLQYAMDIWQGEAASAVEAASYIETHTLPHLLKSHEYTKALDYCEILGKHFSKIADTENALKINKLAFDVLKKMFYQGGM